MTTPNLESVAEFRALHARGELLILPNAWDAGSAALIESCGARAIATSSAALAWAHGYPDGEVLPKEALLDAVSEIMRAIRVPLSVDVEAGFSRKPEQVASLVLELIELGAAGINLEDGTEPPELLAAKIEAVKSAAKREHCDMFVNARTDVVLRQLVPANEAVPEVLARAARYARAGADGLFVPRLAEPDAIRKVVAAVDLPLNVMAIPSLAPLAQLRILRRAPAQRRGRRCEGCPDRGSGCGRALPRRRRQCAPARDADQAEGHERAAEARLTHSAADANAVASWRTMSCEVTSFAGFALGGFPPLLEIERSTSRACARSASTATALLGDVRERIEPEVPQRVLVRDLVRPRRRARRRAARPGARATAARSCRSAGSRTPR